MKAIIVGGGIGGLTTALMLRARGIATLCIGGGMGVATIVERV